MYVTMSKDAWNGEREIACEQCDQIKIAKCSLALSLRSFLIKRDESSYRPNCQTILVIVSHKVSTLFWYFINTTASHLGRYEA